MIFQSSPYMLAVVGLSLTVFAQDNKTADPVQIRAVLHDPVNMAQTNFYYQHGGSWVAFAKRQLQFLDASRRIFTIHATPGALQPTISTIVDTNL